tara:strand:+ start:42 stop:446 length:405 start_codon:yes stop_codon:yes gene_type:complete
MKITVKTTFDFGKLARYVSSGEFSDQANRLLGASIAESSREKIKSGKVTPAITNKETIRRRKSMGVTHKKALLRTEALADSLRATKEGIWGADYGVLHLKGKERPYRDFIAFDEEKVKQPFKALMKKVGQALKK